MKNPELIQQDPLAREQALDISKSFIVQAPAGSGKTELLIQRYLKLLGTVNKPEEVLAITFTKKAANEMRARVVKALNAAQMDPEPETAHAKQTWLLAKKALLIDKQLQWQLLDNPNQLRIQTIDSLCTFLTSQLPMLSHFGSQPDIADKPAELYRQAVCEVLSHLEENYEWSQAIACLLLHLDNDMEKLYQLLVKLLSKRDQWLPYIHFHSSPDVIRSELEETLEHIVVSNLVKVKSSFDPDVTHELASLLKFASNNINPAADKLQISQCQGLTGLPDTDAFHLPAWQGLVNFLMTESNGQYDWRKQAMPNIGFPALNSIKDKIELAENKELRASYKALLTFLSENDALKQHLISIASLPAPQYEDDQWEVLHSLLIALKITAAQLRVTFQQSGKIDFIENAQGALTALGNESSPTDLALAIDYQLKHILVDEFQDTSASQYSLLQKLTAGWSENDGRTLFVVGDPMQSIYRFREAEVGLFIRMWQAGLGEIKLHPITLSVNFRSLAPIVEWNNQHFKRIFPEQDDIITGAVSYSQSASNNNESSIAECVKITGLLNANNDDHAECLVNDIVKIQTQHPGERIAILVRSRSHLASLLPKLKLANLPYRAIDINPLADRQVVIDLLSLTCALLHPADRIAWLAIMRAPWCGLTLKDIHQLIGKHPQNTIWELLSDNEKLLELEAGAQTRIKKLTNVLQQQIQNRDRDSMRTWVETTWQQLGGPATLTTSSDLADAKEYFSILDTIDHTDIDALKEKVSGHYASTTHESDLLQIMTIHSAKGLEFDTVMIPQLHKKPARNDKPLLQWMDQPLESQTGLLLAPVARTGDDSDRIYDFISKHQQMKTRLEIDRLFYVATTRAKKRLYMYFNTEKKSDGTYKTNAGSLLHKLMPLLDFTSNVTLEDCSRGDKDVLTHASTTTLTRLPLHWENPKPVFSADAYLHRKVSGIMLADNTAKYVGTISHRILQQLSISDITWWQNQAEPNLAAFIQRQVQQSGIASSRHEASIQRIQSIVSNVIGDEKGKWILDRHHDAQSEYAITSVNAASPEMLVIDRTFIDSDGTRWIIDYKTSVNSDDELDEFIKKEEKKYRTKMDIYAKAFSHLENRVIKMGLYFPAIPAWKELV